MKIYFAFITVLIGNALFSPGCEVKESIEDQILIDVVTILSASQVEEGGCYVQHVAVFDDAGKEYRAEEGCEEATIEIDRGRRFLGAGVEFSTSCDDIHFITVTVERELR